MANLTLVYGMRLLPRMRWIGRRGYLKLEETGRRSARDHARAGGSKRKSKQLRTSVGSVLRFYPEI